VSAMYFFGDSSDHCVAYLACCFYEFLVTCFTTVKNALIGYPFILLALRYKEKVLERFTFLSMNYRGLSVIPIG